MLFTQNAHRKAIRHRRRFLSTLELLEDRAVPSTVMVTSAADDGSSGTLRATIAAAHSNDTIGFAPQISGKTITLTQGKLVISQNLDIEGPAANHLTISGSGASQVFAIKTGATVTLAGLTIANGKAVTGGGIDNAGVLTIRNSIVSNNTSTGSAALPNGGGGILNEAGATLTLDHTTLSGNVANAFNDTIDVFGGGLLNEGSAIVTSSTFTGNQALGGGGGSFFGGSEGGGIDNYGGATLTVTGSTFTNNQALGTGGGDFGIGGAIESNAGLSDSNPSTATVSSSIFTGNVAGGGAGVAGNGGAIDNEGTGTMMTLSNSTLTNNTSGGAAGLFGDGGGLMNYSGSTLNVTNCSLISNQALPNGNGGGIENSTATMTLSNSYLRDNVSSGGSVSTGLQVQGVGGGIINVFGGTLTVQNSVLTGNQAVGGPNGMPTAAKPLVGGGEGGGIANAFGSTLTLLNSTLTNNVAIGGSSNVGIGGSAVGGGIDNNGSVLSVNNSTFSGNQAIGGNGGTGFRGGFGSGGGLDDSTKPNNPTATAAIMNSVFAGNAAIGGSGGSGAVGGNGVGGAINVGFYALVGLTDPSALTVSDSILVDNLAQGGFGGDGQGGGLAVQAGSSATVNESTITLNMANGGTSKGKGRGGSGNGHGVGGGVYVVGMFTVDPATVIANNHASTSNNDVFP